MPDVYRYDDLPRELRVQIAHIIDDALGSDGGGASLSRQVYKCLHDKLAREFGLFALGDARDPKADFFNFFLKESDTERALDCVELAFVHVMIHGGDRMYIVYAEPSITPADAIEEINGRFRDHCTK